MRCRAVRAMTSTIELLNLVKVELLNKIVYYGGFLNFTETDFVEELDSDEPIFMRYYWRRTVGACKRTKMQNNFVQEEVKWLLCRMW